MSLASGASAATEAADIPTQNTWVSPEITLHEEEISDVSLATFYVFDKENPRPGLQLAGQAAAAATVTAAAAAAEAAAATVTAAAEAAAAMVTAAAVTAPPAVVAAEAAEAASVFGGEAAAAVEVVQAAIGAGRTAFGSGATIDVAGSPKAGFA